MFTKRSPDLSVILILNPDRSLLKMIFSKKPCPLFGISSNNRLNSKFPTFVSANVLSFRVNFFTFASKKDKMKKSIEKDCYSLNIRREK